LNRSAPSLPMMYGTPGGIVVMFGGDMAYWYLAISNLLMRSAIGKKLCRRGRRGGRGRFRCFFFRRAGILFGACRNIDLFLLRFRIFSEAMFFARAAKNQRGGGKGGGGFANTKVQNAPQTNRACVSCAR